MASYDDTPYPDEFNDKVNITISEAFGYSSLALILTICLIIFEWKIFEKAGQAGWKSLIPIYDFIVLLDIIHKPCWWIFLLLLPLIDIIIYVVIMIELGNCFGKGTCFKFGLVLLPFIFLGILAFDKSEYIQFQGNQTFVYDSQPPSHYPIQQPVNFYAKN